MSNYNVSAKQQKKINDNQRVKIAVTSKFTALSIKQRQEAENAIVRKFIRKVVY